MSPMNPGGVHTSPHDTTTRFMMKKGAQQITKVEKTTPRTLLAFSLDTVADICLKLVVNWILDQLFFLELSWISWDILGGVWVALLRSSLQHLQQWRVLL